MTGPDQDWLLRSYPQVQQAYRRVFRLRVALFDETASSTRRLLQLPLLASDIALDRRRRAHRPAPGVALQVLADAAEIGLAAAVDEAPQAQVNLTIPNAAQVGLRHGPVAAVTVPAFHLAVARVASGARRRPMSLVPFVWPVAAGLAGAALAALERRRSRQIAARHRIELAARARRAGLAGEHSLAMGLDSAVDELGNLHWILSAGGATPYRDHKRHLAEQARSEATYLADAVMRWAATHNRASPDLSADVAVTVGRGGSQTLLTDAQVDELLAALDALDLGGPVAVAGPVSHVWGRTLVVEVTSARLSVGLAVSADPTAPVAPLEPTPVVMAMMVPWFWFCTLADFDGVPRWRAAPATIGAAVAAAVLHRRARRGRPVAREGLVVALALGAAHVALATPGVTNARTVEGNQPHPWTGAVYAPLVLLGLERDRLGSLGRAGTLAALAGTIGLGFATYPHRIEPRGLTGVGDAVVAYRAARGWGAALDAQAAELDTDLRAEDDAALTSAFVDGQRRITDYLAGGVADARRRLAAADDVLDPAVRAAVTARLDAIEDLLEQSPG